MSERKFSVGDRVRIARTSMRTPRMIGRVATVTGHRPFGDAAHSYWHGELPRGMELCILDIDSRRPGGVVAYPHHYLEPLYDGNELASWQDCAWQPKHLERA